MATLSDCLETLDRDEVAWNLQHSGQLFGDGSLTPALLSSLLRNCVDDGCRRPAGHGPDAAGVRKSFEGDVVQMLQSLALLVPLPRRAGSS